MASITFKDMTITVSLTGAVNLTCRNLNRPNMPHADLAAMVYPAVSAAADAALPAPLPTEPST